MQVYSSRISLAFIKRLLDGEQSACWLELLTTLYEHTQYMNSRETHEREREKNHS